MKQLIIEEMKRSILLMESKEEIKRTFLVDDVRYPYPRVDRDTVELFALFKMIRRHSRLFERLIDGEVIPEKEDEPDDKTNVTSGT